MAETPRLNGVIRALEEGKPAFATFAAAEVSVAQAIDRKSTRLNSSH